MTMVRMLLLLSLVAGCGDDAAAPDGGADSGVDGGTDVGGDVGNDAERDAQSDALSDATLDAGDAGPTLPVEWDGTLPDEGVCSPHGFCTINPVPTGLGLTDAWAATRDDMWVVGEHGLLMHWDGTAFVGVAAIGGNIESVHGCASDDVWAADSGEESGGVDIGPDKDTTGDPKVLHWDGTRWTDAGVPTRIRSVYCAAPDDVWAVGDFGGVYRWNGTAWTGGTSTEGVLTPFEHIEVLGDTVLVVGTERTLEYVDETVTTYVNTLDVRDLTSDGTRILAATDEGIQEWSSGWVLRDSGAFSVRDAYVIEAASPTSIFALFGPPDTSPWFGRFYDGDSWAIRDEADSCGVNDEPDVRALLAFSDREYAAFQWGEPFVESGEYKCTFALNADVIAGLDFEPQTIELPIEFHDLLLADRDTWRGVTPAGVIYTVSLDGSSDLTVESPLMGTTSLRWTDADTLWVTNGLGSTARWESGTWTEYDTDSMVGVGFSDFAYDESQAWGVSEGTHTGGLYRWTESAGWERILESGVARVEADFGGVWIQRDDGAIEELVDDVWVARPFGDTLRLQAAGRGGRAWAFRVRAGFGRDGLLQWNGSEWLEFELPVLQRDAFAIRGDDVWIEGWQWVDGTWHRHLTGMHAHVESAVLNHGQIWLLGGGSFIARKNL